MREGLTGREAVDGSFEDMWADLRDVGRDRRDRAATPALAWHAPTATLREWFTEQAARRGLTVRGTATATVGLVGRTPDAGRGRRDVVLPAPISTRCRDGGAFDGPLGVVSAFAARRRCCASAASPRRPAAGRRDFADEEGARFGVACARLAAG